MSENNTLSVIYVGNDQKIYDDLMAQIKKTLLDSSVELESARMDGPKSSGIKQFKRIWQNPPQLLFLDFANYDGAPGTKNLFGAMLNLATYVRTDWKTKRITTIAFHDFLASDDTIKKVMLSGVRFNHIKSGETGQSIIQALQKLINPALKVPDFALAKVDREADLLQDIRLGYMNKEYFRVETNVPLRTGAEIELIRHPFMKHFGAMKVLVDKSKEGALFYNYRHSYHLHFNNFLQKEMPSLDLGKIFEGLRNQVFPKWVRVFAIDPELEFLGKEMPNPSTLPYSFKFQSSFDDSLEKIQQFLPQIIAAQNLAPGQVDGLRATISKISGYAPHLLLFKSDTKESNEKTLTTIEPMKWELLEKIYTTYSKKTQPVGMDRIYFKHSLPDGICVIKRTVSVVAFTEFSVIFKCDEELPPWTIFSLSYPINCLVTTIPFPAEMMREEWKGCSFGLFNLVDEKGKMQIRRLINEIFTQDKKDAEAADRESFSQLNLKKEQEKKDQAIAEQKEKEKIKAKEKPE